MKRIVIALTVMVALSSCGAANQGFKASDVKEFAFLQPCAYIDFFTTQGGYYDQGYTNKAAQTIVDVITTERYPFADVTPLDYYDGQHNDAFNWAIGLREIKPSDIKRMRAPKSLTAALKDSPNRYAVFIYSFGYLTSKEAYDKEKFEKELSRAIDNIAEGLTGIKGLTNPSGNYTPSDPYGNEMVCVVIDKDEDRIVYYKKQTPFFPSYPTDNADVRSMLSKLLAAFIR